MPVKTYGIGGGRSTFKGFSTGNVTDISAETGARKVFLKWRDPEDAILNDVVVSAWAGTIVVRKIGGYPESIKDGVQILDSKVRNAYLTDAFVDEDVEAGTEYFYRFFPYSTENVFNYESYNTAKCTPILANPIFAEATWEEIIQACNTHTVPESWKVGDMKQIIYDGNPESGICFKICGKRVDNLADGSGKEELSFVVAGPYWKNYELFYKNWHNEYNSFKKDVMPGLLAKFEENLRNNIKTVTKKMSKYKSYTEYSLVTTNDTLWFLSVAELGGNSSYSDEGPTYPCFTDNASRKYDGITYYLTRSDKRYDRSTGPNVCWVGWDGSVETNTGIGTSNTKWGLVFGFCL